MSEIGNLNEAPFQDGMFFTVPAAVTAPALNLHGEIFVPQKNPAILNKNYTATPSHADVDQKVEEVFLKAKVKPMGVRGGGEVGAVVEWGGKDGTKVGAYLNGEVYDDKGNYIKAEIKQNNDGVGNAALKAGHKDGK